MCHAKCRGSGIHVVRAATGVSATGVALACLAPEDGVTTLQVQRIGCIEGNHVCRRAAMASGDKVDPHRADRDGGRQEGLQDGPGVAQTWVDPDRVVPGSCASSSMLPHPHTRRPASCRKHQVNQSSVALLSCVCSSRFIQAVPPPPIKKIMQAGRFNEETKQLEPLKPEDPQHCIDVLKKPRFWKEHLKHEWTIEKGAPVKALYTTVQDDDNGLKKDLYCQGTIVWVHGPTCKCPRCSSNPEQSKKFRGLYVASDATRHRRPLLCVSPKRHCMRTHLLAVALPLLHVWRGCRGFAQS